jgi:hypothetical protein
LLPLDPDRRDTLCLTAIEGISMMANYIMGDRKGGLAERAGRGEKIGQDSPIQIIDADLDPAGRAIKGTGSGLSYGGNPPSHYNVAQKRIAAIIERSKMLPGWVIWTAHERAAQNKLTGETIVGPEGAGEAATASFPRVFNNTLHFATVEKLTKEADSHTGAQVSMVDAEYRVYTRNHFRAEGKMYTKFLATTRIADPTLMPLYLEGKQGEAIMEFYKILATSRQAAKDKLVNAA